MGGVRDVGGVGNAAAGTICKLLILQQQQEEERKGKCAGKGFFLAASAPMCLELMI